MTVNEFIEKYKSDKFESYLIQNSNVSYWNELIKTYKRDKLNLSDFDIFRVKFICTHKETGIPFDIFCERQIKILENEVRGTEPSQRETTSVNLISHAENVNEIINKAKSPQEKIQAYLYNEINIELYEDFSICYKTETDLLKFFNKLFIEFEFFCNNVNNYLEITDHFVFSEMGYLFWNDENHFNHKTENEKLFELFNLYECLTKLIQFHFPENKRAGVKIKTCEYIIKLGEKIQNLYLPELQKETPIKIEPTQPSPEKRQKTKGNTLKQFFKEEITPEIIETIRSKYKDLKGKKMAYLIYILHKEFNCIDYSLRSIKDSRKRFVAEFTGIQINNIEGINKLFNPNDVTLKNGNKHQNKTPTYEQDPDYKTIKTEIQSILNPIK